MKHKACCLRKERLSRETEIAQLEIQRRAGRLQEQEIRHIAEFGQVRQQVAADFQGQKFVAVGKRLHWSDRWNFFPDFLLDYAPATLGENWWKQEFDKPLTEQHQIVGLRSMCRASMIARQRVGSDRQEAVPNGAMLGYLTFAYDLYTVEHNGRLDSELLRRLRNQEQFQGARHELFAAATCIRAAFSIENEDESDRGTRHAEFTAVHAATRLTISVEAKSKHRPGVLGRPGRPEEEKEFNLRFGGLISDAVSKHPKFPLAIFLDTNLPAQAAKGIFQPESTHPYVPSRIIRKLLDQVRRANGGQDPWRMIVFSNRPHHYGPLDENAAQSHFYSTLSQYPPISDSHVAAFSALHGAAEKHANIPNEFPAE